MYTLCWAQATGTTPICLRGYAHVRRPLQWQPSVIGLHDAPLTARLADERSIVPIKGL